MGEFERLLDKYADLVVRVGVNVQPGQAVVIGGMSPVSLEHADLARRIVAKAYDAGASQVRVFFDDDQIARMSMERTAEDVLANPSAHQARWMEELAEGGAAFISIGGRDPQLYQGVAPSRLRTSGQANAKVFQNMSSYTGTMRVSWCGVAAASAGWAKTVFPDLPADEAVARLWERIFQACRVTADGDAVAAWRDHQAQLRQRQAYLDGAQFQRLHFTAPGTDLAVDLPANHRWLSVGSSTNEQGNAFVPNIPSEEVFTAPQRDGVNGTVRASMPLNYGGGLITGLTLRLEKGKVVEYGAESGLPLLENLLAMDEGARYLGEVAIVPANSPIAEMGVLFYNTLFDENASCHLAFGRAYPICVEGGGAMSGEERQAHGLNQSITHVDFMIGSDQMDVDGVTAAGERVALLRQGNWVANS